MGVTRAAEKVRDPSVTLSLIDRPPGQPRESALAQLPYMKWFYRDFRGDTSHLTPLAELAYRRILEDMWDAGGYLPLDHDVLARRGRARGRDWPAIWEQIRCIKGMIVEETRISHERILEDLEAARDVSEKRSKARRDFLTKQSGTSNSTLEVPRNDIKPSEINGHAEQLFISPSSTPTTEENIDTGVNPETGAAPKKTARPHRLPEGWMPSEAMQKWTLEQMSSAEAGRTLEVFTDYWTGSGKPKVDWNATWRNWVRRDLETPKRGAPNGAAKATENSRTAGFARLRATIDEAKRRRGDPGTNGTGNARRESDHGQLSRLGEGRARRLFDEDH